ncbi:hypothetical protein [Serratia ficaria]|uniref:hypothetical protein n=1 Tax=Serratia ficaria TaxID=61651 RepID=UPI00077CB9BA|nr:hypothetical protein [Serratia ficaria]
MAINGPLSKSQNRTSDNVIYIGSKRKDKIDQMSIEISYRTKKKISTASFFQFLIDRYGDKAMEEYIDEIIKKDNP